MAVWPGQRVGRLTMVLLLVLPVLALMMRKVEARPFNDDYEDDYSAQAEQLLPDGLRRLLSLISTLRNLHMKRHQSIDGMLRNRDFDASEDSSVTLRKRQRQCYWNVVSCY